MISIHLNDVEQLVEYLRAAGCNLSVDRNGQITIEGPEEALTEELASLLRERKPDLMRLLRCDCCGCKDFIDVTIHGGNSVRRDCQRCGRTSGFPLWDPPDT